MADASDLKSDMSKSCMGSSPIKATKENCMKVNNEKIQQLKKQLSNEITKQINELYLKSQDATRTDIQIAYIAGAKMMFNEMVQVSQQLPEHLAEKLLTIFKEVVDEYK
jgi:hypothetical protein